MRPEDMREFQWNRANLMALIPPVATRPTGREFTRHRRRFLQATRCHIPLQSGLRQPVPGNFPADFGAGNLGGQSRMK
jgi:hypothetical protein